MTNRALLSIGLWLGSALFSLFPRGKPARRRTPPVRRLPRSALPATTRGQKLEKSAHKGAALRHLPRVAREVPAPRQHSQAAVRHLPRGPGGRLRQRGAWPGPQEWQRGRARLRQSATAARMSCCLPNRRHSAPPCRIPAACATPTRRNSTAPACMARPSRPASPRRPCAPIATANTRSSNTPTKPPGECANIRETCGGCHGNVRLTQKFGLPSDRLVSFDSSYHGLAAKAGSQTVAKLRELPRGTQHSALVRPEIHH